MWDYSAPHQIALCVAWAAFADHSCALGQVNRLALARSAVVQQMIKTALFNYPGMSRDNKSCMFKTWTGLACGHACFIR